MACLWPCWRPCAPSPLANVLSLDTGPLREAARLATLTFGEDTVNNIAALRSDQGRLDEAGELYERALAGYAAQLGPSHPDTLMTVNNLAILRYKQRRLDEALPLALRAASGYKEQLGADHPHTQFATTLIDMIESALAARAQNKAVDESIEHFPASVSIESHPHALTRMPSVYSGDYGCDICGKGGYGWAYSCVDCGFDCHPLCVVTGPAAGYNRALCRPCWRRRGERGKRRGWRARARSGIGALTGWPWRS